jgi:hypothetical protein
MLDFKLAEAQNHESLTLHPLVDPNPRQLPYQLLRDALEAGTLRVGEVGSGTVPELLVETGGDTDVLILDGEQLIGARQNRMTSRTIVLAANTKTTIPVSCMEHGRWHFTSREFRHGLHYSPANVRRHARKMEAAYAAAREVPSPEALSEAQGDVWDEIAGYNAKLGGRSASGALDHLYDLRSFDMSEWSKHFPWVEDQIGLLVLLGDEPLGMDVIGCHRLYARLHKRLVGGYVLDALAAGRHREERKAIGAEDAKRFLQHVRSATRTEAPTVGRGSYRVLSGKVLGGLLEDQGNLVHLSAFPNSRDQASDETPLRRARYRSRRRRFAD